MFSGGDQTEARGAAFTEFSVIWPQVSGSDDVLKGGRMNLEGCLQMTFLKLKSDVSLLTESLTWFPGPPWSGHLPPATP